MRQSFFSRWALVILCVIFFLIPFGLRGARLSLSRQKNDVTDWLPKSFEETKELEWFAHHFVGERFVVASWEGCNVNDPRYHKMLELIESEIEPRELGPLPEDPVARDDELARRLGSELDLFFTGEYSENWGGRGERWLRGAKNTWYFVTPEGQLYRWAAEDNVMGRGMRALGRWWSGSKVEGLLVEEWQPANPQRYFEDPQRLTARLFSSLLTGPIAAAEMAQPGGALWPRGNVAEEDKPVIAQRRATERLEGTLFGPIIPSEFQWTIESLSEVLTDDDRARLPAQWEEVAEDKLNAVANAHFGGDREAMANAPSVKLTRHWYALCDELNIEPSPPLTCIFVTMSESGSENLARVCGRELLGKPRGQLLALAEEAGVPSIGRDSQLHLGGPPVDNVAIDEEGSVTLMRLVGFSALLGFGLSYLSFRSFVVTIMVFLVGGVAAMTSLAIVYWCGASVDAVLLTMPSLVYVLGLSGAVHIVNYYRDATQETGVEGAEIQALKHGWGPCTLAAFTTALGLLSLYASNILPIRKFGLYSALGVMATLTLLFTYLPAALTLWPPGYEKRRGEGMSGLATAMGKFWDRVGDYTTRHYRLVITGVLACMVLLSLGLFKIETSVQLLKLFDSNAKIIRDYEWLERELGELVPMEVVVRVPKSKLRPVSGDAKQGDAQSASAHDPDEEAFQYSLLERIEMIDTVQRVIEKEFGPAGKAQVGRGVSAATFAYDPPEQGGASQAYRLISNKRLEDRYDTLLDLDYLRHDDVEGYEDAELWRVSLRIGALNDVDYGVFVHELADAVEPVLSAYRHRDQILRQIDVSRRAKGDEAGFLGSQVLLLGVDPAEWDTQEDGSEGESGEDRSGEGEAEAPVGQTRIYTQTLQKLLRDGGFVGEYAPMWLDPSQRSLKELFATDEEFAAALSQFADCVVLVRDHDELDPEFLKKHAKTFVDARDHVYQRLEEPLIRLASGKPTVDDPATLTAAQRGGDAIHAIYTGVIPVVYKAQRTLLRSLAESIGWAFVMIAAVMMVLLRSGPWRADQLVSFRGGLLSMIPNVFPVVVIFGIMGHAGIIVDIGSMMTASVAMGVAVDDTIHFLTWFRTGIRNGLERNAAIKLAYNRCATAMTQTTLIGGVGLSVFAVSTFTPTQRFGVLMLAMLLAALIGDLILLPALLASSAGKYFCPKPDDAPTPSADGALSSDGQTAEANPNASNPTASTDVASTTPVEPGASVRMDSAHADSGSSTASGQGPTPHAGSKPQIIPKTS